MRCSNSHGNEIAIDIDDCSYKVLQKPIAQETVTIHDVYYFFMKERLCIFIKGVDR